MTYRHVTISNVLPRRDSDGQIIDCHEGCLERFGDRFYLYGTAYGDGDAFGLAQNRCVCYSSPDLESWTFHGEILTDVPPSFLFTPDVRYNAKTGKYVLWYNWYPIYWEGHYGVATADAPAGPFTVQNPDVKMRYSDPGDHGLLVDDDGAGYIIYNSIINDHSISVEKLTDDYLGSTQENSGILATNCEGASLFKRDGVYYALFDTCTLMGADGSGARVYMSEAPLGPYTLVSDINRHHGVPIIAAQQVHIAKVPTSTGDQYIWIGTRWQSTPDRIKGHEFQHWARMKFNEDATINPLRWEDEWSIDLQIAGAQATERTPSVPHDDANHKTLGARIRELRAGHNMPLADLAAQLDGVTEAYLSDVEQGRRIPSVEMLEAIASALKAPIDELRAYDTRARVVSTQDVREINEGTAGKREG